MGRRKSKRKPAPKKKNLQPLDKVFACPFCNHEKSCDVKMELDKNTAHIKCTVCSEDFQTVINCNLVDYENFKFIFPFFLLNFI
jgi:transcription elongation factor Elf1